MADLGPKGNPKGTQRWSKHLLKKASKTLPKQFHIWTNLGSQNGVPRIEFSKPFWNLFRVLVKMVLKILPRSSQDGPKWCQGCPKMVPRSSQYGPKVSKILQNGPKITQNDFKMVPRWSQESAKWSQDGPRCSKTVPRCTPKWSQDAPKWSKDSKVSLPVHICLFQLFLCTYGAHTVSVLGRPGPS
jgi:hypothetical protein